MDPTKGANQIHTIEWSYFQRKKGEMKEGVCVHVHLFDFLFTKLQIFCCFECHHHHRFSLIDICHFVMGFHTLTPSAVSPKFTPLLRFTLVSLYLCHRCFRLLLVFTVNTFISEYKYLHRARVLPKLQQQTNKLEAICCKRLWKTAENKKIKVGK